MQKYRPEFFFRDFTVEKKFELGWSIFNFYFFISFRHLKIVCEITKKKSCTKPCQKILRSDHRSLTFILRDWIENFEA